MSRIAITGANRGIGLELARQFAGRGDEVIDLVRAPSRDLLELGVEVKGLDGLVDVRSQYDDRVVYLCWREGEAAFLFWHELDGGFAGRYPITDPDLFEGTLLN